MVLLWLEKADSPRSQWPSSDFVFQDTRTFPVRQPSDVMAAVHSWGRYRGSESFDSFKRRLTALCHRKGPEYVRELPSSWTNKSEVEKGIFTDVVFGQQ